MVHSFLPSLLSVLASPPPTYRKVQMLKALSCQVLDTNGSIKALESQNNYAMRDASAQDIKYSICNYNSTSWSYGDLSSLEDIKIFKTHGVKSIGNTDHAKFPTETPIIVTHKNSTIQIDGDISLVLIPDFIIEEINNKLQTGIIKQSNKI